MKKSTENGPKSLGHVSILPQQAGIGAATRLKHEAFREEQEWRAIYTQFPGRTKLMERSIETLGGIPQPIFKMPIDQRVSPALADIDFGRIFDRLIIGPSNYPWVMVQAFVSELEKAGVADASQRVIPSFIPIRT